MGPSLVFLLPCGLRFCFYFMFSESLCFLCVDYFAFLAFALFVQRLPRKRLSIGAIFVFLLPCNLQLCLYFRFLRVVCLFSEFLYVSSESLPFSFQRPPTKSFSLGLFSCLYFSAVYVCVSVSFFSRIVLVYVSFVLFLLSLIFFPSILFQGHVFLWVRVSCLYFLAVYVCVSTSFCLRYVCFL